MKSILLACTMLLVLFATPAFADTITFTNSGILSGSLTSGVVSTSSDLRIGNLAIGSGPFGTLSFNLGSFTGSLNNGGSFTGGNFELSSSGSVLFVTAFSGTWDKVGNGLYDLAGTFSGTENGVRFSGVTHQLFTLRFNDGRACLLGLRGTTTITALAVPEPASLTLLGTGLLGVVGAMRRKVQAALRA